MFYYFRIVFCVYMYVRACVRARALFSICAVL